MLQHQACSWLQRIFCLATALSVLSYTAASGRLESSTFMRCASSAQQLCLNSVWPSMCLPFPGHHSHLEGEALHPEHRILCPRSRGAVQRGKDPLAAWGGAHWAGEKTPSHAPADVLGWGTSRNELWPGRCRESLALQVSQQGASWAPSSEMLSSSLCLSHVLPLH